MVLVDIPFTRNLILTNQDAHRRVLGSLYNPAFSWPITSTETGEKVDMRLVSRGDLLGEPAALRPAATKMLETIRAQSRQSFAYVSVPGSGKSSALIDLGRERFVVFVQASDVLMTDSEVQKTGASRWSKRETDYNFVQFALEVGETTNDKDKYSPSVRVANYSVARARSAVELLARLLQLVRLKHEMGDAVTPWDFTVQQLAGKQSFVARAVQLLKGAGDDEVNECTQWAMAQLAPALKGRELIVSFDETELGRHVLPGRFQRELGTGSAKGILAPLAHAAWRLSQYTEWNMLFAGTGASAASIQSLKTDVGKDSAFRVISDPKSFPTCSTRDVVALLRRLALSAETQAAIEAVVEPIAPRKDMGDNWTLLDVIEGYCVGARYRVLFATLEHVQNLVLKGKDTAGPDALLQKALEACIGTHQTSLVRLLQSRLKEGHPNALASAVIPEYFTMLYDVYVASQLLNGEAVFSERAFATPDIADLTHLGIASSATEEVCTGVPEAGGDATALSPTFAYRVTERFVLNAIGAFFKVAENVARATAYHIDETMQNLRSVLRKFGPASAFKGNLVERIILHRLVQLSQESRAGFVADLPFFPEDAPADSPWRTVPFVAHTVKTSESLGVSTPAFLASVAAVGIVLSPENVMRPDGVLMLGSTTDVPRRALTLACAVYSDAVPKDKVTNQFSSTDMSRAYLSGDGAWYDATRRKRQEWFDLGLHKTVAVRVHVALPGTALRSSTVKTTQTFERESTAAGSAHKVPIERPSMTTRRASKALPPAAAAQEEQDVIINIDRTNANSLLGIAPGANLLFELLKLATGMPEGWA